MASASNDKIVTSTCTNFLKMLSREKSEGIQINYWQSIQKALISKANYNLEPDVILNIFFKEIYFKYKTIICYKHLLYNINNYCISLNEDKFKQLFFEFLFDVLNSDYDKYKPYFVNYLYETTFHLFFNKVNSSPETNKSMLTFYNTAIETDFKSIEQQLNKYIYYKNNLLLTHFNNNTSIQFFIKFISKALSKRKYVKVSQILKQFQYEIKSSESAIVYKEFYALLIHQINEIAFMAFSKKHLSSFDEFMFMNNIILQLIMNIDLDKEMLDRYLVNILLLIVEHNYFNIEKMKMLLNINDKDTYNTFRKLIHMSLYYLSKHIFLKEHIEFYILNVINKIDPLYGTLIYNSFSKMNVLSYVTKEQLNTINIKKFSFEYTENDITNTNQEFPTYGQIKYDKQNKNKLMYLSLFIVKENVFSINSNTNTLTLNANSLLLHMNELIQFHLDNNINTKYIVSLFCDFFEILLTSAVNSHKQFNFELIQHLLLMTNQTDTEYKSSILYPNLLFITRTILLPQYDLFYIHELKSNLILNEIINYFIFNYGKNEIISNFLFKLLLTFFKETKIKTKQYKLFAIEKLVDLTVLANNGQLNEFLFKYIRELIMSEDSIYYGYFGLYEYARKYEGALNDSIRHFLAEMYDKESSSSDISEKYLFLLCCLVWVYKKDPLDTFQKVFDSLFIRNHYTQMLNKILSSIPSDIHLDNYDNISNAIKMTEYNNYIYDVIEHNHKYNNAHFYFCFLKYLGRLLNIYLGIFYAKKEELNNQENNTEKQLSAFLSQESTIKQHIHFLYNDIDSLIEKSSYNCLCFFINDFISNPIVLNNFLITHSEDKANIFIKEQTLPFSEFQKIKLNYIKTKISNIFAFISKKNALNAILLNNFIISIIENETNLILQNTVNSKGNSLEKKVVTIKNIYKNTIYNKNISFSNNGGSKLQEDFIDMQQECFFSTKLFSFLFKIENLDKTKDIFRLLFDWRFFTGKYKELSNLFNADIILVQLYNLVKLHDEYKELLYYVIMDYMNSSFNESAHLFMLKVLSSEKTFSVVYSPNEMLYRIINDLLGNVILYNSYQEESCDVVINIIRNVQKAKTENEQNVNKYYEDLMLNIKKCLTEYSTKQNLKIKPKFKETILAFIK